MIQSLLQSFSDIYRKYVLLQCRKKSTGFRPNLLVKILKSTGQTCQICHMYEVGSVTVAASKALFCWSNLKADSHL